MFVATVSREVVAPREDVLVRENDELLIKGVLDLDVIDIQVLHSKDREITVFLDFIDLVFKDKPLNRLLMDFAVV